MNTDHSVVSPVSGFEENLKKAMTEMLILHLLSEKECYIGELTDALHTRSNGILTIVFPYSAIYRLQQSGCIIEREKHLSPDGRRRQYFGITETGQVYLRQLRDAYAKFSTGVANILSSGGPKT